MIGVVGVVEEEVEVEILTEGEEDMEEEVVVEEDQAVIVMVMVEDQEGGTAVGMEWKEGDTREEIEVQAIKELNDNNNNGSIEKILKMNMTTFSLLWCK